MATKHRSSQLILHPYSSMSFRYCQTGKRPFLRFYALLQFIVLGKLRAQPVDLAYEQPQIARDDTAARIIVVHHFAHDIDRVVAHLLNLVGNIGHAGAS
ncbi:protein of unknown function [Hyphomicrobium sp. MC1]|nr:protein of unknown function [Hyphomicrobium sp. MC1]